MLNKVFDIYKIFTAFFNLISVIHIFLINAHNWFLVLSLGLVLIYYKAYEYIYIFYFYSIPPSTWSIYLDQM